MGGFDLAVNGIVPTFFPSDRLNKRTRQGSAVAEYVAAFWT
jgi:hypothetical protein